MDKKSWLLFGLWIVLGCSSASPVKVTTLNPKNTADRALAEYDQNKDGYLDEKELERCPGLKAALPFFDKDQDGRLSREELESGFDLMQKLHAGLVATGCRVYLDGEPVAGVQVVLEPEPLLKDQLKPAQGITDESGRAQLQVEGAPVPGCNPGLYRVRISREENGQEIFPERYNKKTQLGLAVGAGKSDVHKFDLTTSEREN